MGVFVPADAPDMYTRERPEDVPQPDRKGFKSPDRRAIRSDSVYSPPLLFAGSSSAGRAIALPRLGSRVRIPNLPLHAGPAGGSRPRLIFSALPAAPSRHGARPVPGSDTAAVQKAVAEQSAPSAWIPPPSPSWARRPPAWADLYREIFGGFTQPSRPTSPRSRTTARATSCSCKCDIPFHSLCVHHFVCRSGARSSRTCQNGRSASSCAMARLLGVRAPGAVAGEQHRPADRRPSSARRARPRRRRDRRAISAWRCVASAGTGMVNRTVRGALRTILAGRRRCSSRRRGSAGATCRGRSNCWSSAPDPRRKSAALWASARTRRLLPDGADVPGGQPLELPSAGRARLRAGTMSRAFAAAYARQPAAASAIAAAPRARRNRSTRTRSRSPRERCAQGQSARGARGVRRERRAPLPLVRHQFEGGRVVFGDARPRPARGP